MIAEVKAGTTEYIEVTFTDSAGALKPGLTPTHTIRCHGGTNDGKYYQADTTWGAAKDDILMIEEDSTNAPGDYNYGFALPAGEYDTVVYKIVADGGATAAPRYATGEIRATSTGPSDQHIVVAAHSHKMTEDRDPDSATFGRVTLTKADNATTLKQFDSSASSGTISRTPV